MKLLLLFFSGLFLLTSSFSQSISKDSLAEIQLKNVIGLYNNYTDGNAPIYNGSEYLYFTFQMDGDPFFESGDSSCGWLSYKGIGYDSLYIKFDLARNHVVLLLRRVESGIVLNNEFIDSFMVASHTFINLKEDHQQKLYNTGFYDLLYNGHTQLLARRTKIMSDKFNYSSITNVFSAKDYFYIHKNGLYYLVGSKKDAFGVLNDKKHELRKAIRQQHLKLRRKNFETTLVKVTAIYDQLFH